MSTRGAPRGTGDTKGWSELRSVAAAGRGRGAVRTGGGFSGGRTEPWKSRRRARSLVTVRVPAWCLLAVPASGTSVRPARATPLGGGVGTARVRLDSRSGTRTGASERVFLHSLLSQRLQLRKVSVSRGRVLGVACPELLPSCSGASCSAGVRPRWWVDRVQHECRGIVKSDRGAQHRWGRAA